MVTMTLVNKIWQHELTVLLLVDQMFQSMESRRKIKQMVKGSLGGT